MSSNPSHADHPHTEASYPSEQAYVVKLLRHAGTKTPRLCGRLVHLASGDVFEFNGGDELVEQLSRDAEARRGVQGLPADHEP